MTKITCVRKIQFCAGHRVLNHEGQCANIHGHNYVAHIFSEAEQLDSIGRIIDFSELKNRIGGWINQHWDHTFLVYEKDDEIIRAFQSFKTPKSLFICPFNPTAENMADYLLNVVCPQQLLKTTVTVKKVILYETENCYAEASLI